MHYVSNLYSSARSLDEKSNTFTLAEERGYISYPHYILSISHYFVLEKIKSYSWVKIIEREK